MAEKIVTVKRASDEEIDTMLNHSGILGMKWGVRREVGSDGRVHQTSKPNESPDHSNAMLIKAKHYKEMSNQELTELNKRWQLEKTYRELKSQDKQKGLEFIKTATAVGATVAAAYALTKTPLGQDIIKSIKSSAKK